MIIGGGFGGLAVAKGLRAAPADVTLVDKRNFHLFQPLLYQVATGGLSPANIAAPLRSILRRQQNTRVLLAEVTDFDVAGRRVLLGERELEFDTLVVAAGGRNHYFGHDEWRSVAPGLKTIEDATEIRRRILRAFEAAEIETDPGRIPEWLTFVVVGGGPTGVELAGAIGEIARNTLCRDFRAINPASARIILVEGADLVLPMYPPDLSASAAAQLTRFGVSLKTGAIVTDIGAESVTLKIGDTIERIATRTTLWAAGVQATGLAKTLAERTNNATDRSGRLIVEPDLSLAGHPNIFVLGDMAAYVHQGEKPLPGVAPVAMQQGRYLAKRIVGKLSGKSDPGPFRYHDKGSMATIGRSAAVADLGAVRLSGFLAWLAWLFIHLMFIIAFESRLLILTQWAFNYFTRNRAARLMTNPPENCAL